MERAFIIIAYDGTEIIDKTVEAENRIADMEYFRERKAREENRKHHRNIIGKISMIYGRI